MTLKIVLEWNSALQTDNVSVIVVTERFSFMFQTCYLFLLAILLGFFSNMQVATDNRSTLKHFWQF